MILILLLLILVLGFVWLQLPLKNWLMASTILLLVTMVIGITHWFFSLLLIIVFSGLCLLLYFFPDIRRQYLSQKIFVYIKKLLPPISQTEREAIQAGTVWWDAELFSGQPNWKILFDSPSPKLTAEEQAFMDGPVEELCAMADDWEITNDKNDLPDHLWDYIRDNGFFGLNASPEYGGLGFSAYAQSCIVQKLSTRSNAVAVTVMVPNSLGPAELLYHYGTDEQKSYYLPRLASGKEIPCFGLTNPWAGSDAESMPDHGVVCKGKYKGKNVLGFRVNWEKRYITLGPVATLLGLAFKAYDPNHLLGDNEDLGITCALVPTDTKGVSIGTRHMPLNAAFQNGPNWGKDVFIPVEWIIGGEACIGQGWRMLMESLAAGRGISLPAAAAGTAKLAARTSGAYVKIREQFGIEIGKFEGIEEVLARIGGLTYLLDAGRKLAVTALALGEKPAVISAIVKQQCTDLSRMVINDAMDVHGGKGICMGKSNYLARNYQQIPIGITVEGANILTRSLIIFGQGSMRCHPFILDEIEAAANSDEADGLDQFDEVFSKHIERVVCNKLRAFGAGLTRGWIAKGCATGMIRKHSRTVEHFSAAFAYLTDITLFYLGGALKRKEMLSGRFADVLSNLYLATSVMKAYKDNGESEKDRPLSDWACQYSLYHAQEAMYEITRNYPNKIIGKILWFTVFPTGRYVHLPQDDLSQRVSDILQTPGAVRDYLTQDIFISKDENDVVAKLEKTFELMVETSELRKKLRKSDDQKTPMESYKQWIERLKSDNVISIEEFNKLDLVRQLVGDVIRVDDFDLNQPQKVNNVEN